MKEELIRYTIIIKGNIQSRGFRSWCYGFTKKKKMFVTGWIQNDRQDPNVVHMEVQGTINCVNNFIKRIQAGDERLLISIDECIKEEIQPIEEDTFVIKN